ncbi:TauD/TfdA dioxygenase family protein [Streptomyces endophyticus]|uniref:TauD/TfdA family dioxygenase n=1 Tax=Streptomyces endophyticus TaxID=714166 RepID=A0ABU6FJ61_9ACTN|nr:TauD/TfdA family dioxygenase [Streptomyces endophyticus]MEB8344094.1 TauD/TfdA family dioxygenase [Streptomyces endophyticus]
MTTSSDPVHTAAPALVPREFTTGGTGEPYRLLDLVPQTPGIGAEVRGLDLSADHGAETFAELKRALLEWKVLFFRDQRLTAQRQAEVAAHWGELEDHAFLPKVEGTKAIRLEHDGSRPGTENIWHSDVTFSETPPLGSLLRAVQVPEVGGDTLWADMGAAYDGLPQDVKDRIENLRAVNEIPLPKGGADAALVESIEAARAAREPVSHPVVRTHPETGRKLLYVNAVFTSRIEGLPEQESRDLLDLLFRQAHYPEYQVRFHWEPGSVAFWDNRAVQHYAVSDYFPRVRVMERVTVLGDRPY